MWCSICFSSLMNLYIQETLTLEAISSGDSDSEWNQVLHPKAIWTHKRLHPVPRQGSPVALSDNFLPTLLPTTSITMVSLNQYHLVAAHQQYHLGWHHQYHLGWRMTLKHLHHILMRWSKPYFCKWCVRLVKMGWRASVLVNQWKSEHTNMKKVKVDQKI